MVAAYWSMDFSLAGLVSDMGKKIHFGPVPDFVLRW